MAVKSALYGQCVSCNSNEHQIYASLKDSTNKPEVGETFSSKYYCEKCEKCTVHTRA